MKEFENISDLRYGNKMESPLHAYIHPSSRRIWITGEDAEQPVMIYTRAKAIALRDWLTRAIGYGK